MAVSALGLGEWNLGCYRHSPAAFTLISGTVSFTAMSAMFIYLLPRVVYFPLLLKLNLGYPGQGKGFAPMGQ